jgi:DNA-binding response OmpR family regulator
LAERILLIEDDRSLGVQVIDQLRRAGYETVWWTEGKPLPPALASSVGLLVLDLMLPGRSGMEILKELRETSELPVLILSARNDSFDKVRALKLGADDYLTKPFWPEELLERIRARLRRPHLQARGPLALGPIELDLANRQVTAGGKVVELTRVEFDLLAALARRRDAAVTRRWLVENVLDPDRDGNERTLDVHVSRLRKKLGAETLIETVWGIGYRLRSGSDR